MPNYDLFGREVFDRISGDTLPLFHQPVDIPGPSRSGVDAKIARKFEDTPTVPMFVAEPYKGHRRPWKSEVESAIRESEIPYVDVDEAKRALFANAKLSAFHFVVYSQADHSSHWLVWAGERTTHARETMHQWAEIFGDGYRAVFAVDRAGGVTFITSEGEKLKLGD